MSWKDYQNKEHVRLRHRRFSKTFVCGASNFRRCRRVAFILAVSVVVISSVAVSKNKIVEVARKIPTQLNLKSDPKSFSQIIGTLPFDSLQEGFSEVKIYRGGKDWKLLLTFDSELQKFIYNKLQQYQVDWAGVSVMDAKTGAVKALVSFSSEEPDADPLSLRATFPAASIFKVVTAGAAVQEKHLNSDTILTYGGDTRYVQKRFLTADKGPGMTLGDAFAHSTNAIFGKVGARYLGKTLLSQYATAFGFNETLPFEFPVGTSKFNDVEAGLVEDAKTAAGLGSVTLSPLHASLIAASVANQGNMMRPYSVEKIMDQDEQTYFEAKPSVWKSPLTKETSSQIQKMMRMTITSGTARKGFREYRKDSTLSLLDIGGKTGSLTGKDPEGRNEWFVGYAKDGNETLAVGIVIVSKKYWKIKPSELAKSLIRYHFKSVKDAEPKAITSSQMTGPHKKATL